MTRCVWTILVVLGIASAVTANGAGAANWSLALDTPAQVASPGAGVTYAGVLTNSTGAPLPIDLSLDFVAAPESEDFTIEFSPELLALDLIVPMSGYAGPIFNVTWGSGIALGTFASGELLLSAFDPADPSVLTAPFTLRTPGVGTFCTESTGFAATSLGIAADDSTNAPVIVYNTAAGLVRLGRIVSEVWTSETVASAVGATATPALALDGNVDPHVLFYLASTGDLRYAVKPGAVWVLSTVDATGNVGLAPAMAIDGAGIRHASYYDATNLDLKYAQGTPSGWTVETVDGAGSVGSASAIAVDDAGRPYIAYYDATLEDLKFAWKNGGVWSIETVDGVGSVGQAPSIQVKDGVVTIAYHDATIGDTALLLATGAFGAWTLETVDDTGDPGASSDLQLNSIGRPRIAYRDAASGQVKYAAKVDGVTWEFGTVDAASTGGVAFALSRTEEPFVTHLAGASTVRFASFGSCATVGVDDGLPLPAGLTLHPSAPNPFSPNTRISFTVGARAATTVRIYDAGGRLVAKPFEGMADPGRMQIDWNGVGVEGRKLPSGVYLFEVQSGTESRQGRLVLMR